MNDRDSRPAPSAARQPVSVLSQYCINVADLDRAIEFWNGVVGIEVCSRTDIPTAREAVLQSPHGGSRMQLAQQLDPSTVTSRAAEREGAPGHLWKLYVNTDDCVGLYARALAAGCESVTEPQRLDRWPVTVAFVRDFDGYLVEFVEYHEGTQQGVPDPKAIAAAEAGGGAAS